MTDHYAVMGNPVAHSKSPRIHAAFASQTQQDLDYTAILVETGKLAEAVADFRLRGGRGLNITVPFKTDAFALADQHSERALKAEAANTLVLNKDGSIFADNTDGAGLVRDLTHNHGLSLQGKRLLVLGAGGAVQGVLLPLLMENPAQLVIANRTAEKAAMLAGKFADAGNVTGGGFELLAGETFDLIINGTAASLKGEVPAIPESVLVRGGVCYDMMYSDEPTAFVRWGNEHGASQSLDGLGMLVEQAAESFYLWRGVQPETATVIQLLRESA
ncbi:shikimate dehydrogenase [Sulfuriflexus sp.]|uniref:shikimate dehydrogenase n=1 Tax=Sulfuriflexus sp. TaxID=2015443 RepID=UPI0028CC6A68|nr:shikimate dehydrogenase [Sulfuriflexus sp.]MDT8405165.1 shikimate dehydrogenase [Sulfuriflexus sp.]